MPDDPRGETVDGLELRHLSMVLVAPGEALLNWASLAPSRYALRWSLDGADRPPVHGGQLSAQHTVRLAVGRALRLEVDLTIIGADARSRQVHRGWTLRDAAPEPAITRIAEAPDPVRRGQRLAVRIDGRGFGPARGARLRLYSPNGSLIADLAGDQPAQPDLKIHWSDAQVRLDVGPTFTRGYPLGTYRYKAQIVPAGQRSGPRRWSAFVVKA